MKTLCDLNRLVCISRLRNNIYIYTHFQIHLLEANKGFAILLIYLHSLFYVLTYRL